MCFILLGIVAAGCHGDYMDLVRRARRLGRRGGAGQRDQRQPAAALDARTGHRAAGVVLHAVTCGGLRANGRLCPGAVSLLP